MHNREEVKANINVLKMDEGDFKNTLYTNTGLSFSLTRKILTHATTYMNLIDIMLSKPDIRDIV